MAKKTRPYSLSAKPHAPSGAGSIRRSTTWAAVLLILLAFKPGESQQARIAADSEPSTQVVANDDQKFSFVQTYKDGAKRSVEISITRDSAVRKAAIQLDGAETIQAESLSVSPRPDGYSLRMSYTIPAESLPPDTANLLVSPDTIWQLASFARYDNPSTPQTSPGISLTVTDTVSNAQSTIQQATSILDSAQIDMIKTAQDVGDMIKELGPKTEGPITRMEDVADKVKNAAKVAEHALKIAKMVKERNAMRDRLRALRKCAENPTAPTAKDAQKKDPRYKESTTDVIDRAERDLTLNTAIRMIAATGNSAASTLLSKAGGPGKFLSKGVGLLAKVEDKMLQHVAEEYIMKDAGKGVVPCDCLPGYSPPPPSEKVESEPPASFSCNAPKPEEMVCRAAPSQPSPPQKPPKPPASSLVCGLLTHVAFTMTKSSNSAGCGPFGGITICGTRSEGEMYSATATIKPVKGGYQGSGVGSYSQLTDVDTVARIPSCGHTHTTQMVNGRVDMKVNAFFSIDNSVTGGLDTGAMPANTSVVEILITSNTLHDEGHKWDCEGHKSEAIDTQAAGFDCHFYYVDLFRGGTYQVYKDRDPASGVCTLTISK